MKSSALLLFIALLLAACSPTPKTSTESKPAAAAKSATDLATGRIALGRMNIPAHMWAADIQPVHLESEPTPDADGAGGKSAVWRSEWVSVAKRSAKDFTWSGSAAANEDSSSRGLTAGSESSWSPANTSMAPFFPGYLKVDSDQAYVTAKKKLTGKDKTTPVKYMLSFDGRKNLLIWHISFGDTSPVTIDIDATTGAYIRTEH
ncbi:MAG: hypothetical protein ABI383_08285 [Acidobacteriaceae bacterium]